MISRLQKLAILFFYALTTVIPTTIFSFSYEMDRQALLAIKSRITVDPFGVLSSWNDSVHFCRWRGVKCRRPGDRVVALNLSSSQLAGSLSPHIGNLSFLRVIDLGDNSFHGEIPGEVGRLFRLQELFLLNNSFQGEIPTNLTYCSELRVATLEANQLGGKIPSELGLLSKLHFLGLAFNQFVGTIPHSLGNLTSLSILSLPFNNLTGSIPAELGRLSNLTYFSMGANNLSGMLPRQLFMNFSSVNLVSIAKNGLSGEIPDDICSVLPNLENFFAGMNQFTGQIPTSLVNCSKLVQIDMSRNALTGSVPNDLGVLQNLQKLNFEYNQIGSGDYATGLAFLSSLANCTKLQSVSFHQNQLQGLLPGSIANFSKTLNQLFLSFNPIYGSIPSEIGNLVGLNLLEFCYNLLSGKVPDSIGRLSNLQGLYLYGNQISGTIPSSIGNISGLSVLDLEANLLQGPIPVSLGNCTYLQGLSLSNNHLSGVIPKQVIGLSSLSIGLFLSSNNLWGPLPSEVSNLRNLNQLDISNNAISGKIPTALESCQMLEILNISGNFLEGTIPYSLSKLRGIQVMDLSRNNLSGKIPYFLSELPDLTTLNLSYNSFQGEVPTKGVFQNTDAFSILGNKQELCGGIKALKLAMCPKTIPNEGNHFQRKVIIAATVVFSILLLLAGLVAVLYSIKSSKKKLGFTSSLESKLLRLSYADLLHATDGFSSANLIGKGRYGFVYKGTLTCNNQTVAVKVFNLQEQGASNTFSAECEALRKIRHRNLIKIITSCSSLDFHGDEFKALVFEFMPNRSLQSWLHPDTIQAQDSRNLSLVQRLNIAIDVASAIDYLHSQYEMTIVHCDLKPSNILLDNDFTAHVTDFGLTKFLSVAREISIQESSSSIGVRGTIGYVAPEYGLGHQVSTSGDVYSYGVILLELFTGRCPTESKSAGTFYLHDFVKNALPEHVIEIVDPRVLDVERGRENVERIMETLVLLFEIGVRCSASSPRERMNIKDVLLELHKIKSVLLSCRIMEEMRRKHHILVGKATPNNIR